MENKPSMFTITLGYGVIISLALIVFSLILYLAGLDTNPWLMYLSYVLLIAGIVLVQLNFRNKYMGGYIEYGKAFTVGLMTSVFIAVLVGIYTFVFFKYIDPGKMEESMILAEQKMMDRGMNDQEVDQAMAMMQKMQTVGMYTFFAVIGNLIAGVIISLITSIFVKKEGYGQDMPPAE
jgi:uncharacterized membrane-anchored protein